MNLLGLLLKGLSSAAALDAMAKKTGISGKQLKKFLPLVIPILLKAMTSNASSKPGAQSLLGALTQHTNKKPLADQISDADEQDGQAIIGHILGNSSGTVVNQLSDESGLNSTQINAIMSLIAPALLSSLSAANNAAAQAQAQQQTEPAKPAAKPKKPAAKPKKPGADAEVLTLGGQSSGASGVSMADFLQMFGAADEPEVQQQSSSSLLQSLLGKKEDEQQSSNGGALLNLLLQSALK